MTTPAGKGASPEALARMLRKFRQQKSESGHSTESTIPRVDRSKLLPASFGQEQLWLLDRLEPGTSVFNMPSATRYVGNLDVKLLELCLKEIDRRHETLRTSFDLLDGEVVQVLSEPSLESLPLVDLMAVPQEERRRKLDELIAEDAATPFDLAQGPLYRVQLVRLGVEEHVLLMNIHHIVSDGWSLGVFFSELTRLYDAGKSGQMLSDVLKPLDVQYADFSAWQRDELSGERLEKQLAYWREKLADAAPELDLPTDFLRQVNLSHRGGRALLRLDSRLTNALNELSRQEGVSLFMILLAAFKLILRRYTGQDDIIVGAPNAGRQRVETEPLIGFFLNTLVLRTEVGDDITFRELLQRVKETVLGAFGHQDLPFDRLMAEIQPERHLSRTPLFQVLFNMMNAPSTKDGSSELKREFLPLPAVESKFDFTWYLAEKEDEIKVDVVFNADLFRQDRMDEMLAQFASVLEQAVSDPQCHIHRFTLVTDSAREVLPSLEQSLDDTWRGSIQDEFDRHAARAPGHIAVSDPSDSWTYEELQRRANQLAHHLRRHGIETGDPVAVYAHRNASLVWSLLGILKAGAAFVVLDPAYPSSRLVDYVRLSSPRGLIEIEGAGELPSELADYFDEMAVCRLRLPSLSGARASGFLEDEDAGSPEVIVGADDVAYISFTSGSTGKPKGILGRHGPLTHFLPWLREEFGFSAEDRNTMISALSHDPLQRDIFFPLGFGATICIPDPEQLGSPDYLVRWAAEQRVTILNAVPAVVSLLGNSGKDAPRLESLRYAVVVGDVLTRDVVEQLYELSSTVKCLNFYGSTETQRSVSYHVVPRRGMTSSDGPEGKSVLPLGRGFSGVQLIVRNTSGTQTGVGELGEIYFRSHHMAKGYLGDTAEDRFINTEKGRLYKTGDLGRYLPDGSVEFAGRADHQVKLRGFRIELGEIEATLGRHAGVDECVVTVYDDAALGRLLVAYFVASPDAQPTEGELRAWLTECLPDYMVPSVYVPLSALPLSYTGKVNRKALPAPSVSVGRTLRERVAPRTAEEEVLATLWTQILRIEDLSVNDDFFELGGHSLLAMRLLGRLRETFNVELTLRQIFEASTIEKQAIAIRQAEQLSEGLIVPPLKRQTYSSSDVVPLSFAQQRVWFIEQLAPGTMAHIIPGVLRLRGPLNREALKRSLAEVVARHSVLRTVFPCDDDGNPQQVVTPVGDWGVASLDLSSLKDEERARELKAIIDRESHEPFDVDAGPLIRAVLVTLGGTGGDEESYLILSVHHLVFDGRSFGVLIDEMMQLYTTWSHEAEAPSPLPELPIQYSDFSVWERGWLRDEALEAQLAWWRDHLKGAAPVLELPTDRPRPPKQTFRGAQRYHTLSRDQHRAVHELGQQFGATTFMVLMAAWKSLLWRISPQNDIVVGTPIARRTHVELEALIGFFANTLALHTRFVPGTSFEEVVRSVRDSLLGASARQEMPFEKLVEELEIERNLSYSPIFQVAFSLQIANFTLSAGDLVIEPLPPEVDRSQFDLNFVVVDVGDVFRCRIEYNTDLFDGSTVERFLKLYEEFLAGAVERPSLLVRDVALSQTVVAEQVLREWSGISTNYPRDLTLVELFDDWRLREPEAPAIHFDGITWTYADLERRSNQLGNVLREKGVQAGSIVAVVMERSAEQIAAFLAILKAGGTYLPLDPSYPEDRLAFMLEDAGTGAIVAQRELLAKLPDHSASVLCIERDSEQISAASEDPLPKVGEPLSAAYIVYTSGSTGRPKGIVVPQRAVVRLVQNTNYIRILPGDRVAQASNSSFDAATFEIWGALTNGGCLVGIPRSVTLSPPQLARDLSRLQIDHIFLTTALFNQLVQETDSVFAGLKTVLFGGERCDPGRVRSVMEGQSPETLLHVYGPTESTTFATYFKVGHVAVDAPTVPIGVAIANTSLQVVDRWGRPQPMGVPGELWLGGDGLAHGYLKRPRLTAEKFVPGSANGAMGERFYRTGDLVRQLADGNIDFLGRIDHQVKIRGFRIELGEIEAVLVENEKVRDCIVLAREDSPGDRRLAAYVVADSDAVQANDLREFVQARLPFFMVPQDWVMLESLPLNPNGKVDHRALPVPERGAASAFEAPQTGLEKILAEIWQDVLGVERVGLDDNFFALGGHSLLATQVVSRLRRIADIDAPVAVLFETGNLREAAQSMERHLLDGEGGREKLDGLSISSVDGSKDESSAALTIQLVDRSQPIPASFGQEQLWLFDRLEPNSAVFNMPLVNRLRFKVDIKALEGALTELVRRHETLRTVFRFNLSEDGSQGELEQQILPPYEVVLIPINVGAPGRLDGLIREETKAPFDLEQGPLYRTRLLRLSPDDYVLIQNVHHIISDGWSMTVLMREFSALYDAAVDGRALSEVLPPLPIQYADYAAWQRKELSGEALERQLTYWREQLSNIPPVLELPTDYQRPAVPKHRGRQLTRDLDKDLCKALDSLCQSTGTTPFMVLLAAFQFLLHRLSGEDQIVVGAPSAGRQQVETEGLIGFFLNTLVLRCDFLPESAPTTFRDLLKQVRETVLAAFAHQDVPFDKLVAELKPERHLSRTPFFQVLFNMINLPAVGDGLIGHAGESVESTEVGSKYDFTFYVQQSRGSIHINLTYDIDLFRRERMEELLSQFSFLLRQMSSDPDMPLQNASLVTEAARAILPLPDEPVDDTWHGTWHARLSKLAGASPDKVALVDSKESWSYGDLNQRSNQLAHYLQRQSVSLGEPVAIYAHRSTALVWAIAGVLKAGAAFVIFDPAYPTARLCDYVRLAKPVAWLEIEGAGDVPAELLQELGDVPSCRLAHTGVASAFLGDESEENLDISRKPDDLAYIAFTSGSTGEPKGILGNHGGLTHFQPWLAEQFDFGESDRFSLLSALSHDPLLRDVFFPLWYGATLVIPDPMQIASPGYLARWMHQQKITVSNLVPAMLHVLCHTGPQAPVLDELRYAVVVGDVLTRSDVAALYELSPSVTCVNVYGATETQRALSYQVIPREDLTALHDGLMEKKAVLPVGKGFGGVQLLVCRRDGELAGVGEPGEIYFRSHHLAKGYLDPSLNDERFLANPWTSDSGDRLFRSGDFGRYLSDGAVELIGRGDSQVKLRGFRIELGEIEALLNLHPRIAESVVIISGAKDGDVAHRRLVAYIVPETGDDGPDVAALRDYLNRRLPDYMVPSAFIELEVLPLTHSGKVDRKALPAPELAAAGTHREFEAPATKQEEQAAALWAEVLRVERVGRQDNFFELGGHSLLGTQLLARLYREFGVQLGLHSLYRYPTLRELTAEIVRQQTQTLDSGTMENLLAEIQDMSEEEIEKLLSEEDV